MCHFVLVYSEIHLPLFAHSVSILLLKNLIVASLLASDGLPLSQRDGDTNQDDDTIELS